MEKTLKERISELSTRKIEFGNTNTLITVLRNRCEYRIANKQPTEENDRETSFLLAILAALIKLEQLEKNS